MRRLVFASLIILAGCGFDGTYRYSCQDPENWEKSECNPPECLVDGTCTEILLGFDPDSVDGVIVPTTLVVDTTQGVVVP